MTVDSLVAAAREQRLVSTGVEGVKSWLEAHETVHGAMEKVARPFAKPLKSLVGVADKAIGLSVSVVEEKVYKPVVVKNGDFTISGAVEVANHNMTDLAKTTYISVQQQVSSAFNYMIAEDSDGESSQNGLVFRIKHSAEHLAVDARNFSQKRLPVDVLGLADQAAAKSKSLTSTTYANARSALALTTQTACQALHHVSKVGIFSLPKEVGVVGLQTIGFVSRGSEYATIRSTIGQLFNAYKRLVLFETPHNPDKPQNPTNTEMPQNPETPQNRSN